MSYSKIVNLEEIINKKVLFYDLETTGLVKTTRGLKPEEEYPNYEELDKYNNARIVSIGWIYMKKFNYDNEINIENINESIIKPNGFEIPKEAIAIHGITNEEANMKGKNIKDMLKEIGKIIKNCDYIIGYNVYYDINILLSELYRKKRNITIEKILKLKAEEKIICMGQISSKEAKPDKFYKYNIYAIPKQTEVYKKCFNNELINAHNAKADVLGMIKIMYWIYENKIKEKYIKITDIPEFENFEVSNFGNVRNIITQNLLQGQIYENNIIYEHNKKQIYGQELVSLFHLPKPKSEPTSEPKSELELESKPSPESEKILIHLDKNTINNNVNNLKWIEKSNINTEVNHGKKWQNNEFEELIKEVNEKKKLLDISLSHKRRYGSIRCAIIKLFQMKKITEKDIKYYKIIINKEYCNKIIENDC